MSKKVHPYSFRLGTTRGWRSRWFNLRNYRRLLKEDVLIREKLQKKLRGMYVENIEIERTPSSFHIIIKTSRPGLLIGRKGEGSEKLKKEIQKEFYKIRGALPPEIKLSVEEVRFPETNAKIISQIIAENLEKRLPFRRVMKQTMSKIMSNRNVGGAKIILSGRLGGADMGRIEKMKEGKIPLQTLRADIDFAKERARLPYGDIGIKVWIYKGEKFE